MFLWVALAKPFEGGPAVFLGIADRVASGQVPYRDFVLEYPPLALFPIVLPRYLAGPGSIDTYQTIFTIVSVLLTIALGAVLVWLAQRRWSAIPARETLLAYACILLAAAPQIFWRFDILPALLVGIALVAVATGRPAWAGLSLGLGMAVKLYPAFLVPVLVLYYLFDRRWKSAGAVVFGFAAISIGLVAEIFLVGGTDAFTFLAYQGERGVEIESVLGGILMLAHDLVGTRADVHFAFGSYEVSSPLTTSLAIPAFLFQVVMGLGVLAGALIGFARDRRIFGAVRVRTLVSYLLATVILVMLANKVLSPQYIGWLLPFAALLPWRQALLVVVICALTTFVYPIHFADLRAADPVAVAALNVRNLLLLVLFAWLVWPARRSRAVASERGDVGEAPEHSGGDAEREQAHGQATSSLGDDEHQ
jgi:hypothetical protein